MADDKKPPEPGSSDPPRRRLSATGCQSADHLARLRQEDRINPSFAQALALHLAGPCPTCLQRLMSLPSLVDERGSLVRRLPATDHALIRALRTLGGWPPRGWLQVERRRALEAMGQPYGFLWLILEEARQILPWEKLPEVERWHGVLIGWIEARGWQHQRGHPASALVTRAHLYLAEARNEAGGYSKALDLAEGGCRMPRVISEDAFLVALGGEIGARLDETPGTGRSNGLYRAAERCLYLAGHIERLAEVVLSHARARLRRGDIEGTLYELERVVPLIEDELEAPLLTRSLQQLRAVLALARVEVAGVGLPRLLASARLAGALAGLPTIPALFDSELFREDIRLRARLAEQEEQHRTDWLVTETLPRVQGRAEAMVRAALVASPPYAQEQRDRLGELVKDPEIAAEVFGTLPGLRRAARELGRAQGLPRELAPIVEALERLEAEGAKP